jgi:hypothetical protein
MWKLLWKSRHEYTKVIFTIQISGGLQMQGIYNRQLNPKHITRGIGETQNDSANVLPIHRMSSPVYIGIIAMHAAKQI